jgi:hypothetical protein
MKVTIQVAESEELKALPILVRHSPGTMLRDGVYIVEEDAAEALRAAGIEFEESTVQ